MQKIGRFAPSPSGPLHMGSLITALASYLDIKQQGGQWYVRMDDLDPPRQSSAASRAILTALEAHGLTGDRQIEYQSNHQTTYELALQQLAAQLYYCNCPRKKVSQYPTYPGFCRRTPRQLPEFALQMSIDAAVRMTTTELDIEFVDQITGHQSAIAGIDFGDFIVRRRDGLWAYNFAAAIDDATQATQILRGQDLLDMTAPQIFLMQQLNLPVPTYTHIPVLCYADGTKLSKQTHAPAIENGHAANNLRQALDYLGQKPPRNQEWTTHQWLVWGQENWHLGNIPKQLEPFITHNDDIN